MQHLPDPQDANTCLGFKFNTVGAHITEGVTICMSVMYKLISGTDALRMGIAFKDDNGQNYICLLYTSLLTLAENSVKHATRPDRPLTVQITAKSLPMEGEKLVNITVRDNGDGFPEEVMKELNSGKQMATGHYGLTNVQRRCALLFGPDFAMTFTNAAAGGAVVEMYIPLPDAAEEAKEEEKHETVDRG